MDSTTRGEADIERSRRSLGYTHAVYGGGAGEIAGSTVGKPFRRQGIEVDTRQ